MSSNARNLMKGFWAMCLAAALLLSPMVAQSQEKSMIDEVVKNDVLRVGLSLFTPWAMRDKNGELIGFEIDVATQLGSDLGVEVEFIPTAWDGIIPALVSGKFDVIISGMTRTTQRNITVNFTEPYNYAGLTVLANKKLTEGFTLEDYNSPDVTLVTRRGGSVFADIKRLFPLAKLLQFDDEGAVFQEMVSGKAHATLSPEPTPSDIVRQYPDIMHIPFADTFGAIGESFALRRGDPDSLNLLNNWIQGKWRTGWLKERSTYWFKSDAWFDQVKQ
jgi:polar amino acid transport system substrate-binding protein